MKSIKKLLATVRAALLVPRKKLFGGKVPNGWTFASVLLMLAGVAVCYFTISVLVTATFKSLHIVLLRVLPSDVQTLIFLDVAIIGWSWIMFYTNLYSWFFVENNPGKGSAWSSKFASGEKGNLDGIFISLTRWGGKPLWISVPINGILVNKVIVMDTKEMDRPLAIICQADGGGQTDATFHFKFNIEPPNQPDEMKLFIYTDPKKITADAFANTRELLLSWCKLRTESTLFADIREDREPTPESLRWYLKNAYGDENVMSSFEKKIHAQITSLMFTDFVQDEATKKRAQAEAEFTTAALGIQKLSGAFTPEMRNKVDPDLVLFTAASITGAEMGKPFLVIGGNGQGHGGGDKNVDKLAKLFEFIEDEAKKGKK